MYRPGVVYNGCKSDTGASEMLCPNRGDKTTYSYFIPTISRGEKEEARSFSLLFIYIECMYFFFLRLAIGWWGPCVVSSSPSRFESLPYTTAHTTQFSFSLSFSCLYTAGTTGTWTVIDARDVTGEKRKLMSNDQATLIPFSFLSLSLPPTNSSLFLFQQKKFLKTFSFLFFRDRLGTYSSLFFSKRLNNSPEGCPISLSLSLVD